MTTLAVNTPRDQVVGDINEFAVIASDIIYEGAAVGLVKASGHAQPLTSSDLFVGFAEAKADNSDGAAAAINVRVKKRGCVKLAVTGAVITDVGAPVYAQDDNAFSFVKTSGVFVGFMRRFVASGYAEVEYDVGNFVDPHEGLLAETTAVDMTLTVDDTQKVIYVTAADVTITIPAIATAGTYRIVNGGAYGTIGLDVAPNAADAIVSPGITGTANHGLINTKTTSQRGDFIEFTYGTADGWIVTKMRGVWADNDNS